VPASLGRVRGGVAKKIKITLTIFMAMGMTSWYLITGKEKLIFLFIIVGSTTLTEILVLGNEIVKMRRAAYDKATAKTKLG